MARLCVLHIGLHKTGTSSIQRTLAEGLDDPNFTYLNMGAVNHSGIMTNAFGSARKRARHQANVGRTSDHADRIQQRVSRTLSAALADQPDKNMIISGESMSGLTQDELVAMRDQLQQHFTDFRIVGYVRPPKSHIQSLYQQEIKSRSVALDPQSLKRIYEFRIQLQKFDTVFGAANVNLYKYDPALFPEGDVVRHFAAKIGITVPEQLFRTNESLKKPAVQALYAYHRLTSSPARTPRLRKTKQKVARMLSEIDGERFSISDSLLTPAVAACTESIRSLESRMGVDLSETLPDLPGAVTSDADMLNISPAGLSEIERVVGGRTALPDRDSEPAYYAADLIEALMRATRRKQKRDEE